jgi:hypothetical protein
VCTLDDEPQLMPTPDSSLPGGDAVRLWRQYRFTQRGVDHFAWGVYIRLMWGDDTWANHWLPVAVWLAPHAERDGYAGFFRMESEEEPTLLLLRRGVAYLCEFGRQPLPLV